MCIGTYLKYIHFNDIEINCIIFGRTYLLNSIIIENFYQVHHLKLFIKFTGELLVLQTHTFITTYFIFIFIYVDG